MDRFVIGVLIGFFGYGLLISVEGVANKIRELYVINKWKS